MLKIILRYWLSRRVKTETRFLKASCQSQLIYYVPVIYFLLLSLCNLFLPFGLKNWPLSSFLDHPRKSISSPRFSFSKSSSAIQTLFTRNKKLEFSLHSTSHILFHRINFLLAQLLFSIYTFVNNWFNQRFVRFILYK